AVKKAWIATGAPSPTAAVGSAATSGGLRGGAARNSMHRKRFMVGSDIRESRTWVGGGCWLTELRIAPLLVRDSLSSAFYRCAKGATTEQKPGRRPVFLALASWPGSGLKMIIRMHRSNPP